MSHTKGGFSFNCMTSRGHCDLPLQSAVHQRRPEGDSLSF